MAASCSLLLVNYKTAMLAAEAIRTARLASRSPLQVVVVDNSVDSHQADVLRRYADVVIAPEKNLGYAAAINRARRSCDGEVLLVSNADVRFGVQAIDHLMDADAPVAGPALYWDDAFQWHLPPSELHTARQTLDRVIASRWNEWRLSRDRRRFRRRVAFWSLRKPAVVDAISGAVMAIRARVFDRMGGFDERFRLYFEETDFLRRLRTGILYVPTARCRHIYNQSAGTSPEAAHEYARSEFEYLRKWNGAPFARSAKWIERAPDAADMPPATEITVEDQTAVVEASPLPDFDTAAGFFVSGRTVKIPPEVWDAYRGPVLYVRVVQRDTGAVIAAYARTRIPA
jgi:GT2 family glycosyltransferase